MSTQQIVIIAVGIAVGLGVTVLFDGIGGVLVAIALGLLLGWFYRQWTDRQDGPGA